MIAGLLAALIAAAVGYLVAGIVAPASGPVAAVAEASIDLTPPPVKNFAVSNFGTDDKLVLLSGIAVVLAVFAAIVGALAVRRLWYGMAGAGLLRRDRPVRGADQAERHARVPTADPGRGRGRGVRPDPAGPRCAARCRAAAEGAPARRRAAPEGAPARPRRPPARGGPPEPYRPAIPASPERRTFLITGGVTAGAAAVAYLGGRVLTENTSVSQAQASLRIPRPRTPRPSCRPGVTCGYPG